MNSTGGALALTIDRLRVSGSALTAERAERLRALVEMEVRRRLERKGLPGDLRDAGVIGVQAPPVTPERDGPAAAAIAEQIVHALGGGR